MFQQSEKGLCQNSYSVSSGHFYVGFHGEVMFRKRLILLEEKANISLFLNLCFAIYRDGGKGKSADVENS